MLPYVVLHPSVPLGPLDDISRGILLQNARRRHIRRAEILGVNGDPSINVFLVVEGLLLLYRVSEAGREIAFDCLSSGDSYGLEDVLCQQLYSLSCRATTNGIVWQIPAGDLKSIVLENRVLAEAVIRWLGQRLRLQAEHTELLTLENLSERVQVILRRLCHRSTLYEEKMFLPIDQSDLAALAGASRQRTNAILVRLRKTGALDHGRRGLNLNRRWFESD